MITGLAMEVGDGRRTRFWEDVWIMGGSLKDRYPRLFSVSNQRGSVIGDCGFWDGLTWIWNFQWRRELFQWELELVNQLHNTLRIVKLALGREDRVVWKYDKKGIFSTNSFVQMLQVEMAPEDISSYNFTRSIWKGLVPPRVELFVWFGLIGRVNTKERLRRFGVWCAWISHVGLQWIYPGTVKEHFQSWTEASINKEERKSLMVCFCAIMWNIWLERNRRIFQNKEKGVEEIINLSVQSYTEWLGADPFSC
ncbi:uncharacterized protein LOC107644693 [Arachis ipaensis]|uniref:uncharacterized protein LOC107644693 n=1 Tax=Arachis ipaensis TaxID=130454 RepID=UPI0007AF64DF|nr:uncharacterized protein LOC107644693 [Arachis ipaensis]